MTRLSIDRHSLGLDRFAWYEFFVKWKVSDAIYAVLIIIADYFYFETIQPYQRQFTINDLTISHPFAQVERVSGPALLLWIIVLPCTVIPIVTLLLTPRPFKIYVTYISLLGVFISMGTCTFVTDVLKNWIGRCRPDFLARCVPIASAKPDVLYFAKEVCTTKDMYTLMDGFRTTPSGHSSMSWASFGYVSMWLNGQLDCRHVHKGAWRSLIAFLPCLLAFYVALSRTQDYRHHFVDIIIGSLLGAFIAWWSYRRYFPELSSDDCYVPYALTNDSVSSHDHYRDIQIARGDYVPTGEV
ncbi:hypothetical protein CANINC_002994 [Pichia inconspicua]|uniref:Phosphatidic acid phosphatase type 2/haloperoxidase domain-containing protein n=1 Tax=Pichia inconspicua TaxID=52247 RepID=A0A4T0X074_9ASCO|nr:hypothetical protein CANINC_002994 [[Candida] inconspicua]